MTRPRSRLRNHRWPACRRPGSIPGRRFALVLVLATVLAPGGVAAADENASQQVTAFVYARGKATTTDSVTIGQLTSQNCPTYQGPSTDFLGGPGSLPGSTWSLSAVLGCLATPIPVTGVYQVIVQQLNGDFEHQSGSVLTHRDLTSPAFSVAGEVPAISSDGSNIIYNRPARNPGDANQRDYVEDPFPSPFVFNVYEGPPFGVSVHASQTKVKVGDTVNFSASTSLSNPSGLTYVWSFDNAASNSPSPTPFVTFRAKGSYPVTVLVGDAGTGGGGTATLTITVGPPPLSATGQHKQTGTGKSPKSKSPNGPQKSGGANVSGPAGKSKPKSSGTTPGHQHKSGGSSQPPAKHRKQTVRKPKGAAHKQAAAPAKLPTPAPVARPAQAPLITGRLVSDVQLLPADASPLVQSTPASVATAPPAREAIRASLLPGLAGALSIVLLFTLGAGRELRGRHGWRGWRGWRKLRAEH